MTVSLWFDIQGSRADSDNQICIIVFADLRGRVARKSREAVTKWHWRLCLKKDADFYPIWHEKPYASLPISLLLLITRYITVDCLVTFLLWQAMISLTWKSRHTLQTHCFKSFASDLKVPWWVSWERQWKSDLHYSPRETERCISYEYLLEVLIDRDVPHVKDNTADEQSRELTERYLTSRYPFISLNNVGRSNRTVLICDLDRQAQVICASVLGLVTAWICDLAAGSYCNSVLIFEIGFPVESNIFSIFIFIFYNGEKKKNFESIQKMFIAMHIRSSVVLFFCVTSQYSKIYTVNDFQ